MYLVDNYGLGGEGEQWLHYGFAEKAFLPYMVNHRHISKKLLKIIERWKFTHIALHDLAPS